MKAPLLICDDFAADALAVRDAVVAGGFATQVGPDGARYTGIAQHPVTHWYDRIGLLLGRPITPRLSCFRLNLEGELPHSWVHSDDICAEYASVLYLNLPKQCQGGTAFWRHKALGIEALPRREALQEAGLNDEAFYELVEREWKHLPAWEQVGLAEMQFNRFISYPTSFFHSRFPHEGFGVTPASGRLIWICFYDIDEKD